jgi:phosphatidate cytidylyltransferase
VTFIATAAFSDIGGYAAGALLGAPPDGSCDQPKEVVGGFAGSVVACMLVGWALVTMALEGDWWVGVVLGVVVAFTATTGDLVESVIKRDLGIKDMGTLLPGHGGVMDRLDSLLLVAPVCWLMLQLVEAA